jgi:hypothetical protein
MVATTYWPYFGSKETPQISSLICEEIYTKIIVRVEEKE